MAQGGLDPDKLFGKEDPMKIYKLIEELAVGSYGRVYKVPPPTAHLLHPAPLFCEY